MYIDSTAAQISEQPNAPITRTTMPKSTEDKEALLNAAYDLFKQDPERYGKESAIKELEETVPGFSERQYKSALTRVISLFENACKLVFRWSTDKPPGTVFELPDENRIFVDDLTKQCRGFSEDQYLEALEYGFKKAIF